MSPEGGPFIDGDFAATLDDATMRSFGTGGACDAWEVVAGCGWPPEGLDEELEAQAWDAACDVVWGLTGQRFGTCTVTVHYRLGAEETCLPTPILWRGRWFNLRQPLDWPCCALPLDSPLGPVTEVLGVTWNDVALTNWVLDGDRLINLTGCWPTDIVCVPSILAVTFRAGSPVPTLARLASAQLAREIVAPCLGQPCVLPGNVTSITRQGVTITLGDPSTLLTAGLTGIALLDLAIRRYNPNRLQQRSRVFSPDVPRPRVR